MDNSIGTFKDHQQIKKNPWPYYVARPEGRNGEFYNSSPGEALSMRYHQSCIMKQPIDSKCGMCYKAEEHVKRIVAGCTTLAPSEYTTGHSEVAGWLHPQDDT